MFPISAFSVFQDGLSLIIPNYLAFVKVFIPVIRKMRHSAKKQAVKEREVTAGLG